MTKKQQQQNKKNQTLQEQNFQFCGENFLSAKIVKKIHPQTSLRKQTNSKPKQQ